jgi:glycine cleavage system protein P-like pyridoxal-binding family
MVRGAMLAAPTETEGKPCLDQFIGEPSSVADRGRARGESLRAPRTLAFGRNIMGIQKKNGSSIIKSL